jgi:hypothetical protein
VFDLFQDLEGFSLDEYRPFEDVSDGLRRLVEFLSASLPDRGQRLVRHGDDLLEIVDAAGKRVAMLTTDRAKATEDENLELLGLDHPIVEGELSKWRALDPTRVGACVNTGRSEAALLAMWLIEASNAHNERKSLVQSIAVDTKSGVRIPAIERQIESTFRKTEAEPFLSTAARLEAFHQHLEPTLERELQMKGVLGENGSFTAELIGLLEVQ